MRVIVRTYEQKTFNIEKLTPRLVKDLASQCGIHGKFIVYREDTGQRLTPADIQQLSGDITIVIEPYNEAG